MAKKRVRRRAGQMKTQQAFEGEGFPEPAPLPVRKGRDEYLQAMRDCAAASKEKAAAQEKLIELMHKHGIDRIELDGENKFFEIEQTEKIKTKTVPQEERNRRLSASDED